MNIALFPHYFKLLFYYFFSIAIKRVAADETGLAVMRRPDVAAL